jgi:uncharacterized protein
MSERFPQLFWGLVALGVSLVVSSAVGAGAIRDIRRARDEITVTGSARRPIRSDFVVWRPTVTSQQAALPQASQDLRRHADRVRGYLREHGVADSAVVVRPVETYAIPEVVERGRETGRVLGYRLTQMFEVRSADVDGITRLAQEIGEVISEGVPLTAAPPEYLFTKLGDIRVAMLAAATRDARGRAQEIAKSAGSELGDVRNVRMGVFQITPRFSTEVSDMGINDVSSLEKDITAVVRVSFALR